MKIFKFCNAIMITITTVFSLDGQNLVSNSDFSDAVKMPNKFSQIKLAKGWFNGNKGTVDFYHKDAKPSTGMNVFDNKTGTQEPFSGYGYAGIIAYFDNQGTKPGKYTEYVTTKLSVPLVAGQQYDVKFRVSLSEKSGRAVSGLGVYISKEAGLKISSSYIKATPQVKSNKVIKDMTKWTEISGRFVAKGGETKLTIGVFNKPDKVERTVEMNVTNNKRAYYYVDGVELTTFNEPDSDNDGVVDKEDKCPSVPGLVAFNGCPDTDNDGVTDEEDKCPTVPGLKNFYGCPDTDNDSIADYEDKCPKVAGTKANNGCPEIDNKVKAIFERALTGIQFESGKDVIKKSSYSILNEVVQVMTSNPEFNIEINGHTDASGDNSKNLELSKKRAATVKTYLESKNIASTRMTSNGFGETMPIADNDTTEGKAKNRRVEFVVIF